MESKQKENIYKGMVLSIIRKNWREIMLKVQSKVGCSNTYFEILFSHLRVEDITDEKLYILAPDKVIVDLLKEKYICEMENAVKETLGLSIQIAITVMNKDKYLEMIRRLWPKVLMQVKNNLNISQVSYETFIKYLKVYDLYNNTLVILAPDDIMIEYVAQKYKKEMERIVKLIIKENLSIEFTTPKH